MVASQGWGCGCNITNSQNRCVDCNSITPYFNRVIGKEKSGGGQQ